MIGQTISHYKILEKLGEGGMGVVYKAQDTNLDRLVALKFLPADLITPGEQIQRFEQEAKAIAALNHPNIATIYDVGEAQGQQYLVLEYIPGGTLKSRLKQLKSEDKEFSVGEVLQFGMQMTEALAHAHRHGIIHRDVKTDNLMLTGEGVIKLTDFGLAKLRGSIKLTKTGTTVGTVSYMSPEQVRGEEVDHRSDIFSLGIVLYELATSRLPFRGEFETAITYSILNEKPPSLRSLRKDAPAALEGIVDRCLEKDKTKRYQSADEIVSDLKIIQHEASGTAAKAAGIKKTWWWAAAVVLVLVAAGMYFLIPSSGLPSENSRTIAVLPFTNWSGAEDEYFTDGITEDILTQLSKISSLKVISRTTMMLYKGTRKPLKEIGKELNAGIVLEGSVRRSGNRLRITGQLINAETDAHIWAETYDRDIQDVFAIQSDVAQKIASAFKVALTQGEKDRIVKQPTGNTEAYNYYLRGREYYYRLKKQDNEEAIELFKKAISIDPNYALAWAGLGDAYAQRGPRYGLSGNWLDSAMAVSRKAIELDSSSAEAYKALGLVYIWEGYYDSSIAANLNAVKLNPNYWIAIHNIGAAYSNLGELAQSVPWFKQAMPMAPQVPVHSAWLGNVYRMVGEDRKAEEYLRKASDLQSDEQSVYRNMTRFYLSQGKDRDATELMNKLCALYSDNANILEWGGYVAAMSGDLTKAKEYYRRSRGGTMLGHIFMKEGERTQAEKILSKEGITAGENMNCGVQGGGPEYTLACVYAIQGKKKEACTYLEKAIERGVKDYRLTVRDPRFERIRDDEEFKDLIARMKAKADEQKKLIDAMETDEAR